MVNIPASYWVFLTLFVGLLGLVILGGILFVVLDPLADTGDGGGATATVFTQTTLRQGPTVDLSRVPSQSVLGVAIPIIVSASDDEFGMRQIQLYINGQLEADPILLEGQLQAQVNYAWVPGQLGPTVIVIRAFSADPNTEVTEIQSIIQVVAPDENVNIATIVTFALDLQAGDDPFAIALDYGVCPDELLANNEQLASVQPGQSIEIPTNTGRATANYGLCERNNLLSFETVNFFSNQRIGVHRNFDLVDAPYPINPRYPITPGRGFECSQFFTGVDAQDPTYGCPAAKPYMHTGIDIGAEKGAPLFAVAGGVVTFAGTFVEWLGDPNYTDLCFQYSGSEEPHEGYGNMVLLQRGETVFLYAHLSEFNVTAGDTVEVGDVIGFVGSTGCSTAPHLHFEVRQGIRRLPPVEYLENVAS